MAALGGAKIEAISITAYEAHSCATSWAATRRLRLSSLRWTTVAEH